MSPETMYTQSGDVMVAYQVMGQGPLDLVIAPGFVSHIEQAWEDPSYARFLQQLSSFSRVIFFDKRGTGMSERTVEVGTLEQRMDDVRAVMEAAGSKRAALLGVSEGAAMSILFAATYPERVHALILYGGLARDTWAPGYPFRGVSSDEQLEEWLSQWRQEWGGPFGIDMWAPSRAKDERFKLWFAKYLRLAGTPKSVARLVRMNREIDVRDILPAIRVPTLVLHRTGDRAVEVANGRYLADHIPGSKYVELDGEDHLWWVGDSASILNEIEEFLTGERHALEPDRVLATVMFTDIVRSTERMSELGDRRWRDLLDGHNKVMLKQIDRYRGRVIKNTGDGFLATFDGPARAIHCALAVGQEMHNMGIEIRSGLHTGEVEIIGEDLGGISVHTACRIMANARADEVWTSRTVRDLVAGSQFKFREQGTFQLRGIPGDWPLFIVEP
jgi:class 3 adenylate cyclase